MRALLLGVEPLFTADVHWSQRDDIAVLCPDVIPNVFACSGKFPYTYTSPGIVLRRKSGF